jgi:hypothetical protein
MNHDEPESVNEKRPVGWVDSRRAGMRPTASRSVSVGLVPMNRDSTYPTPLGETL